MLRYLIFLGLILLAGDNYSQSGNNRCTPPRFTEGDFRTWCSRQVAHYAIEDGPKGLVAIRCTIAATGEAVNPEVVYCTDSALIYVAFQCFKEMPRWVAAQENGRPVASECVLPFYIGERDVFVVAENMPVFPEGDFQEWINRQAITVARQQNLHGRLYVSFIVEPDGQVGQPDILFLRTPNTQDSLPIVEATQRIFQKLPRWIPARIGATKVPCSLTTRISFQQQDTLFPSPYSTPKDQPAHSLPPDSEEWLKNHLNYPVHAFEKRLSGSVKVKFEITPYGKIQQVRAISSSHKELNQAAIEAIRNMPDWRPAIHSSKPHLSEQYLTVNFSLEEAILLTPDEAPRFSQGDIHHWIDQKANPSFGYLLYAPHGKATFRLIIEKDGSVSRPELLQSSGDVVLDAEASRILDKMPSWTPARHHGQTVRTVCILPVEFKGNPKPDFRILRDELPVFTQGNIKEWLRNHTYYPHSAFEEDVNTFDQPSETLVYVKFNIEPDGSITDPRIITGYRFQEEALRVIRSMPRWKPALRQGKPIKSSYTLPIIFRLVCFQPY